MPEIPSGLHAPLTNQATEESAPTAEQSYDPDVGSDEGVVEAAGEVEPEGHESMALESAAAEFEAPDTSSLLDIGAASFADPGIVLETVHGPDNRVKINDTAKYPYRAIASLLITARDGSQWIGTGWFIGPRTLVTAGHCVYIKNSGVPGRDGWVRSMQVLPGRNGPSLPYGSATSTAFWTVRGWAESGNENYDYGAIIIPINLGSRVGTFGFGAFSDATLTGRIVNVTGYPGDKPAGTMWHDSKAVAALSPSKVHYDIDTFGGQSGAPVYMIRDGKRYGVAVHAYGGATTNSGTRISMPVFQNLLNWRV